MDLDPTLPGGLEMGLKICPMKTSSTDILIRLEIEQLFIQLSNDIFIGWITLQYFAA